MVSLELSRSSHPSHLPSNSHNPPVQASSAEQRAKKILRIQQSKNSIDGWEAELRQCVSEYEIMLAPPNAHIVVTGLKLFRFIAKWNIYSSLLFQKHSFV